VGLVAADGCLPARGVHRQNGGNEEVRFAVCTYMLYVHTARRSDSLYVHRCCMYIQRIGPRNASRWLATKASEPFNERIDNRRHTTPAPVTAPHLEPSEYFYIKALVKVL
jgi:hypothetical protein